MLKSEAIEFHEMRDFLVLAKNPCITDAASELHIAQPALSRKVRKLEGTLGVELLDRRNRNRFRLSPAGEVFAMGCRAILAAVDEAFERTRLTCDK